VSESGEAGKVEEAAPLADPDEMLFRQVHPNFFDGAPTSQAFRPNTGDEGMMSVDRGSKSTPERAFVWFTKTKESVGTWGFTVGELSTETQLDAIPDPLADNDAHSFVDFRGLSRKQCESQSKLLRRKAVERGCLFEPAPS
jgi:hypothetical protein